MPPFCHPYRICWSATTNRPAAPAAMSVRVSPLAVAAVVRRIVTVMLKIIISVGESALPTQQQSVALSQRSGRRLSRSSSSSRRSHRRKRRRRPGFQLLSTQQGLSTQLNHDNDDDDDGSMLDQHYLSEDTFGFFIGHSDLQSSLFASPWRASCCCFQWPFTSNEWPPIIC